MSRRKSRTNSNHGNQGTPDQSGAGDQHPHDQGQTQVVAAPPTTNPAFAKGDPSLRADKEVGLADVEESFRVLNEQAIATMREQTDAFESVMQTALGAISDRTRLTAEKASLQSIREGLEEECDRLSTSWKKVQEQLEGATETINELRASNSAYEQEITEVQGANESLESQVARLTTANKELTATKEAAEKDLRHATSKCRQTEARAEAVESVNVELGDELQQIKVEHAKVCRDFESTTSRLQSVEASNRDLQKRKGDLEQQVSSQRSRIGELDNQIKVVVHEDAQLRHTNKELKDEIKTLQADCEALRLRAEAAVKEQAKLQSTRATLETCLADLTSRAASEDSESLQPALLAAQQEVAELKSRLLEAEAEDNSLEPELEEAEKEIAQLKARLAAHAEGATDSFEPELMEAEKEIARLKTQLAELESGSGSTGPEVEALQTQVSNLKSTLEDRTHQLEEATSQLEEAWSQAGDGAAQPAQGGGIPPHMINELASQAECARQLMQSLQQPKIDGDMHRQLVKHASELALQLDLHRAAAEFGQPEPLVELTTEAVDLTELLTGTLETLAATVSRNGLGLTNRIDPLVPGQIQTDAQRLQQLVCWSTMFMTRNASEGDIAVSVTVENGDNGKMLRFQMYNDGMGVSPEDREDILSQATPGNCSDEVEKFSRIAEAMGGRLRIEPAGKVGFAVRAEIELKPVESGKGNRRESDRILQELLQCNLGPVVDLSTSGMRLVSHKNLRGKVVVEINETMPPLKLKAHVVWTNKIDRKQFEVGVRFVNLRPADSEQLLKVARKHGLSAAG